MAAPMPDHLARTGRLLWATWPRRLAVVATALLGLLLVLRLARGREVPAYLVEARPLVQRVVATGRVRPPARVTLASLVMGRVRAVAAREGDRVAAGQLLVRLEDAELAAALRQAQGRVAEAAARLEQVRGVAGRQAAEALHQAELKVAQAEQDAARARALADAGSTSRQAQDDAGRALEVARSQREAAAAQAASAAGGPDERLAVAALLQAEAARAVAAARLAETEVRAPAAGQVVLRDVEPGDVVAAGRAVLALTVDGPLELTAQVDEKNLAFLALGQPARASADAFPAQVFDATVALIAPAVDAARGTVEVRLAVPAPPAALRADMTVSVNVEVGRKPSALVLPAEVVRDPTGEPWVLGIRGGRAERRAVTLGLRGDGLVEIAGGLAAGDPVVAPGGGFVAPGDRVRPLPQPAPGASRAL
jgi:HlyD family secretion protein